MQAIIIAGGYGTRMGKLGKTTPKTLLPIEGKTLLDYLLTHLKKNNIDNIIVCTGFLGDKIKNHIKQKKYELKISISKENKPLGTAGTLNLIKDKLEGEFFVIYGDEFTTVNLAKMLKFHKSKRADATLAVHISDHPEDSTVAKIDKGNRILNLVEKPGSNWKRYGNLTVTPLFILNRGVLNFIPKNRKVDFEKDVFQEMTKKQKLLFGYKTSEFVKDIGTPKRYSEVKKYVIKYLHK